MSPVGSANNCKKFCISGSTAKLNLKRPSSQKQKTVRDILVPCHNQNVCSTIWKKHDLRRVQTASHIVTKEERQRLLENHEANRRQLEWESEKRKRFLQEIDKEREKKMGKKSPFADEEADNAAKIRDRVFLAKHEEAEEVKRANRIILATKCHIVRDAQINEKQELQREWRDEELRLEKMMLERNAKALEKEKQRQQQLKVLNEQHANELKKALEYRELQKFLEARRIEDEAKALAKAQIAITNDRLAKQKAKREQILRLRNDLKESNEITNFYKNLAFEEKRAAEMKAQEYMRMKGEQEKQLEHERRLQREQKQREADRLLALQTQFIQTKDKQETMNMRRIQEQKEREFRQKEKEAVLKRKEMQQLVIKTRGTQIEEMKRIRAIQEASAQSEHQQTMEKLKEAEAREKAEKRKLNELKEKYRKAIITQIEQKEMNKREMKLRSRNEVDRELQQENLRRQNIRNVIAAKVNAMRESKIPEKFVRDVERQLNLNDN